MSDRKLLTALENEIVKYAPDFEVKFKNESKLMKFIGKILFFTKGFMRDFITVLGSKVYFPTKEGYESSPSSSFEILTHEFVHILDNKAHPFLFKMRFVFPQILAAPGLLFILLSPILIPLLCLSILSPWWLMILTSLLFLAPIPSPGRKKIELRGYGMSCRTKVWLYGSVHQRNLDHYISSFIGPMYYFMWPFKNYITKKLKQYCQKDNPDFLEKDPNPAWKVVRKVIKENGELHE